MPSPLQREVRRLQRLWRLHRAYRWLLYGLILSLSLIDALALIARMRPLLHQRTLLLLVPFLPAGIGTLSAVLGLLWPTPGEKIIRKLDRQLHLADRLTTALELATGQLKAPPLLRRLQFEETRRTLARLDARQAFPWHPPRAFSRSALALLLLMIPLLAMPNPQEAVLAERERLETVAEEAASRLQEAAESLQSNPALDEATRREVEQILEEAMAKLQDPDRTPEEKIAALTEAERRLEALRSPESEALVRHLSEAAPLSTETVVRPLAAALERGDVKAAAAYLRSLTDPENGRPLTPEEALALADALAQMADQLAGSEPELASQFREAAEAIYGGDAENARRALQETAETLESVARRQAPNEAIQEAQAQLQEAETRLAQATGQSQSRLSPTSANSPQRGQHPSGGQPSSTQGRQGSGQQTGMLGTGQQGQGDGDGQGNGQTQSGHHEDSGSSAPYGAEAGRIEGSGDEITIPRKSEGGEGITGIAAPGNSRVPYREIYTTYRREAEATLSRRPLPPALRTYVRTYFASLEP